MSPVRCICGADPEREAHSADCSRWREWCRQDEREELEDLMWLPRAADNVEVDDG